jgi:hypothetical protein
VSPLAEASPRQQAPSGPIEAVSEAAKADGPRLLALLDDPAFRQLEDAWGRSARAVAVGRLLDLGFPWALHISPEDLAFARARQPRWTPARQVAAAMMLVTGMVCGLVGVAATSVDVGAGLLITAYGAACLVAPLVERRRRTLQAVALAAPLVVGALAMLDVFFLSNTVVLGWGIGVAAVLALVSAAAMPHLEGSGRSWR